MSGFHKSGHKYMNIISRVLAQHTISNLIVMDGPCLLGHWMKNGEDNTYMQIANYYMCIANIHGYIATFYGYVAT